MPEPEINQRQVDSASRKRILLVEDDNALRRFLEVSLERAGYQVVLAGDGLEGIQLVEVGRIDLVITDAMMPNLSGHELCRYLRNSPKLSHIPIIVLSGMERKNVTSELELADAFLAKPVAAEELLKYVAKLVA